MKEAPFPENEAQRLFMLRALRLLDTPIDERFDRITRVVQNALDVPIATVTFVDDTRQWFKSCQGLCATQTSRRDAFCAHAILSKELMIVPDATADIRFFDNPLVVGDPFIRFYAGHPITLRGSFVLGTLCAIDTRPRQLTEAQTNILKDLAAIAESEIAAQALTLSEDDVRLTLKKPNSA